MLRRNVLTTFSQNEFDLTGLKIRGGRVLTDKTRKILDDSQIDGSYEHWDVMKDVLSLEAWKMY
jgi:hypothetical protein